MTGAVKARNPGDMNAYKIVKEFENAVAEYTGAPYAVAVDSCTNAIFLVLKYLDKKTDIEIPKKTYVSVPQSIYHAGCGVRFRDENWSGVYQLKGSPVLDSAKRFTKEMYVTGSYMCLSFHGRKILKIGRGGMILTDNKDAVQWLKRARFDGRTEGVPTGEDKFTIGWNMYMLPEQAARGLTQMMFLPDHNEDDLMENYPDLSKQSHLWLGPRHRK